MLSRHCTTALGAAAPRLPAWVHWRPRKIQRLAAQALPVIKVVGVGGSASRMVGHLWDSDPSGCLEMMILDTDVQELSSTFLPDHDRLLIGGKICSWTGTRGDFNLGQAAALESSDDITGALQGADLVFLLAGMAGGTGGGAAAVVADIARQLGAFTVAIAMLPESRLPAIDKAVQALQGATDALLTVTGPCFEPGSQGCDATFLPISSCIQGFASLLTGFDPVSLEEVQAAMAGSSSTLGFAVAKGPERVTRAAFAAVSSPQAMACLQDASGVACFISGAEDLSEAQLEDVQEALSSQSSSPAAFHVRCIPAGLPAGHVAVTVVATKRWSPESTGSGSSSSSSINTSAAEGDTCGGAAAEDAALHEDHDQH